MIKIDEMLLTNHNRPKKKLIKLKGIVIHWTANINRGADALANRNYFNNTARACSAHYIVDDKKIIHCIPDNEVAYHVGASKYAQVGLSILDNPYSPNFFLIGVEMCVNSDGEWQNTYDNAIKLTAFLVKKYKLSVNDVYRHYDITKKACPLMLIKSIAWNKFKSDIETSITKNLK
jgi:N-acetylmuramoyl-L-alanine amidase